MQTRKYSKLTLITVILFLTLSAQAVTIDFESKSLEQDGFRVSLLSGNALYESWSRNIPNSGSESLLVNQGSPASIQLSAISGEEFDLFGFVASEGRKTDQMWYPQYASTGLFVEGFYASGGKFSISLELDQIANVDVQNGFEKFRLYGFERLSSVRLTAFGGDSAYSFGIDDIHVEYSPVPDYGLNSFSLLGLSLLALVVLNRKRCLC